MLLLGQLLLSLLAMLSLYLDLPLDFPGLLIVNIVFFHFKHTCNVFLIVLLIRLY